MPHFAVFHCLLIIRGVPNIRSIRSAGGPVLVFRYFYRGMCARWLPALLLCAATTCAEAQVAASFPLSSVPQLSSHPQSTVKIYLDFAGAPAQTWGSYSPPNTPAYDTDGDNTTFSSKELDQIQEI